MDKTELQPADEGPPGWAKQEAAHGLRRKGGRRCLVR